MRWIVPDVPDYEINFCDSVYLNSISEVNSSVVSDGAAICDKNTGQLLFFTDGEKVWNNKFQQMSNGDSLNGGWQSTQPAVIVPQPGSTNIFYIFTDDLVYTGSNGLEYSIVDMSKDGGLGDVTIKNVFLDSSSQYVTAVYNAVNNSFWVIACNYVTGNFMAFLLNANGLNTTPVLSPSHVNILLNYQVAGYLKGSCNGENIVGVFEYPAVIGLYNFDKNAGLLNLRTFLPIQINNEEAGQASFSPDNSKLYVAAGDPDNSEIYQYTVTSNDSNAIKSSRITIDSLHSSSLFFDMQMGSDGKIYIGGNADSLDVIEQPDSIGKACNFILDKISIPAENNNLGLSNNIDGLYYFATAPNINLSGSVACNKTASFTINTQKTYNYFKVCFGDSTNVSLDSTQHTFTHQYNSAGTYTVKLYTAIGCVYDSATTTVTVDTVKCPGSLIIPNFIYTGGSQTQWHINSLPYNTAVTLYDELGRIIYKTSNYPNNYDMRNLASAMYFYRLDLVGGEEYTGKIVVVK